MTPENNNNGGDAPIRSSIEIAMSGQRPMDNTSTQPESTNTPIQSALEKAMSGERPPITHEINDPSIAPIQGSYESQGLSSNPVDLNKYTENLKPDISAVTQNWENGFSNTPSVVVAAERNNVKTEKNSPEKTIHEKEMETYEKEHNDGFNGKHLSQEGVKALGVQDMIVDLAKENKKLMERLDKMQATLDKLASKSTSTTPYDQDPALAEALDPNKVRPLNPLEDVKNKTIEEQNKKAQQFVDQVNEEDRLHNPLNPNYAPSGIETTSADSSEAEGQAEKNRIERDRKKKLLIAGVIGGGVGLTAAALGGAAIALPVTITLGAAGAIGTVVKMVGERQTYSLYQMEKKATDSAEKAKLKEKREKWEKVLKWTDRAIAFIGGAGFGYMAGSLVSKAFFGGHGLLNSGPTGSGYHPTNLNGEPNPRGGEGGTSIGHQPIESGQPFDSGLVKDGRVVLPGDPSNGNLATGPIGNLPGGELNPNNALGGQSDLGWWKLNQYLNANHIKVSDLQAAGGDIHRMGYALQVDPTQTLPDLLNKFGGSSVLGQNAGLGSTGIIR
ncbi:hypothetical protein KKA50_03265 [Patescibacteria group bacterium]|nr:hypothetical protein [Patescibacteria group bacterium]